MRAERKDVEYFEDQRVAMYDQFIPVVIPTYDYIIKTLPQLMEAELGEQSKGQILIAGCGTGNETKIFAEYNAEWKITACDPSPEMVAIAREKLCDCSNVNLQTATVEQLNETQKFDAATLVLVLHFLTDDGAKLDLLKDIASRLKPGAPFFLVDISGTEKEIDQNLDLLLKTLPKEWPQEALDKTRNNIQNQINSVSEQRNIDLLEEAGFETPVRFHQAMIYKGWVTRKKN